MLNAYSLKLLILRERSHSSFAHDNAPGDLIPQMQALNLLEKIH